MKKSLFLLSGITIAGGALFSSLALAEPTSAAPTSISELAPLPESSRVKIKRDGSHPLPSVYISNECGPNARCLKPRPSAALQVADRPIPLPHPQDVLSGEAMFRERIAISPNSKLHVALVGRVAGAEYLPIAAGIFPARNGVTPFELKIPQGMAPAGPYRLQAWIVSDNRLMFNGRQPETVISSLTEPANIMLKMVSAPRNIDGIGDGKPLPKPSVTAGIEGVMPMFAIVKGQVSKLDRRGIAPDAEVEVTVSDVSRADAPAEVLTTRKFSLSGKQLPLNFELPVRVDKGRMKPNGRYVISAKVYEGGKLSYVTDTFTPISAENANKPFELRVSRIFINPAR